MRTQSQSPGLGRPGLNKAVKTPSGKTKAPKKAKK